MIHCFNQLAGVNAINVYANRLLVQMEEQGGGSFPLSPRQGTYVIGAMNGLGATLSVLVVMYFGRKSILVVGQFFIGLFMFLCGLCIMQEWNSTSFVMINLLIVTFHLTQGSIAWLYTSEVCIDAAQGFTASGQWVNLMIISLTFEFMINSPLKVYGSLWYFASLSIIGSLLMACLVRETRGLTDLEKKTLYTPKKVGVMHFDKVY